MSQAKTIKKIFSRETSVNINIDATAEKIWNILTNAGHYPNWNSTVVSILGTIEPEGNIQLRSVLDTKRVFKLKVKEFEFNKRLVWGDFMGKRTFLLTNNENGGTNFSMLEKIGGPLFPLFARMIPSFDDSFNSFAQELKAEAER